MSTTSIRETKKYSLYKGYAQTAELYSVLRRKRDPMDTIGYTNTWMNKFQKDELMKMSDEEFDNYCNKIDFQ